MVRLNLLIISLLSIFIFNACGNSNPNKPANIDDQEAVIYKTGKIAGQAKRTIEREQNDKGEIVVKEEKEIFEDVKIEADFDKRTVVLSAKTLNDDKKMEDVVYEGQFDETGLALLTPKNSKIKTKALVRCVDTCDRLVADIGIKDQKSGKIEYAQYEIEDAKVAKVNPDADINDSELREVFSGNSNLTTGEKSSTPVKQAPVVKKGDQKTTAKPDFSDVKAGSPIQAPEIDENFEDEMVEPGIETGKYQRILTDDVLTDAKDIKAALIPFDLGDKYPGKARGSYNRGSLFKGTDIISNVINVANAGFTSVRGDTYHYGSGLLIKIIEEAGAIYNKFFPGDKFEVNDVAKKDGGKLPGHQSHQNGLDADILIPKKSGKIDFEKTWKIIKSFNKPETELLIWSPNLMNQLCSYLKTSGEKDYASTFSKLYKDDLSKRCVARKGRRCVKSGRFYVHTSHMHLRVKCTPHNPSCKPMSYTKSKFGVCQ